MTVDAELSDYVLLDNIGEEVTPIEDQLAANERPWPLPSLTFDVTDKTATIFTSTVVDPVPYYTRICTGVFKRLYTRSKDCPRHVRSVKIVIREMDGIAYTIGKENKEIHLSTRYLATIDPSRLRHEIDGVLCHELVHCFQRNGNDTCPGWLIEGIADCRF